MTNANITLVSPQLAVTAAQAVSTSTLVIIDTNHNSFDRTAIYTSSDYVSQTVAGTPLRAALNSAFLPSPKNSFVVAGRAKGTASLAPQDVADGELYEVTITVADGASVVASYTASVAEDAEDACTALKADIDAVTDITDHVTATVVGTGADAVLEVSLNTSDDDYTLSALSENLEVTYTTTEAATDTLSEIQKFYTDGFGFVISTDHTVTYVASMMAACEVANKIYVTSTQASDAYSTLFDGVTAPASSDVGAVAKFNQYEFTHVMYHDKADTEFPEAARITEFNWITPGETNWEHKSIGFGVAQNVSEGRALSDGELINLASRNMSTVLSAKKNIVVAGWTGTGNRVATGARIEHVNFGQFAKENLETILMNYLVRVRKEGMNDAGIGRVKGQMEAWLNRYVGPQQALNPARPYKLVFPKASDLSFEDQASGLLQSTTAELYMNASIDAIHVVPLTITFAEL